MTNQDIASLRNFIMPRMRDHKWNDAEDPMARVEGKGFNLGIKTICAELDKAFKELEALIEKP